MRRRRSLLLGGMALLCLPVGYAVADYLVTPGGTLTVFAFTCFATKACPASVPMTSAGTELMTAAVPAQVSLANTAANATALNVAGNLTNISGTITLPTGASTSALQTTGNGTLTTIATNTGTVPAGAATSALQGTGNTSLGTIVTNTTGLATSAAQGTAQTSLNSIVANTAASVPTLQGPTTGGAATALISCNAHAFLHITTATTTNIVPGVTSQNVYICGWRSRAAGVATWFLAEFDGHRVHLYQQHADERHCDRGGQHRRGDEPGVMERLEDGGDEPRRLHHFAPARAVSTSTSGTPSSDDPAPQFACRSRRPALSSRAARAAGADRSG